MSHHADKGEEEIAHRTKWFVRYEVEGFPGTKEAGPYDYSEAYEHALDIGGSERVHSVKLVPKTNA